MISDYIYKRFYLNLKKFINIRINLICLSFVFGILIFFQNIFGVFTILILLLLPRGKVIISIIITLGGFIYIAHINNVIKVNIDIPNNNIYTAEVIASPSPKEFDKELILRIQGYNNYIITKIDKYYPIDIYDTLIFKGDIKLIENKPISEFDYKSYNLSRRVSAEVKNFKIISSEKSSSFMKVLSKIKLRLQEDVNSILNEPDSSLINGILFGEDSNLSDVLKNDLKLTGIYHIISVSGFNVNIIFSCTFLLLSQVINRRKTILLAIISTIIFMLFIGLNNLPVIRATLMLSFTYIGLYLGRKVTALSSLLLSTVIILLIYPYYIINISLLLSSLATLGIILTSKLGKDLLSIETVQNLFSDFKTSLAALTSTSFITYLAFKEVNLTGLITNLFILPFIPLIMLIGIIIIALKETVGGITLYILRIIISYLFKAFYLVTHFIGSNLQISFQSIHIIFILIFILIGIDFQSFKTKYKSHNTSSFNL